jgi:hypothetical protein
LPIMSLQWLFPCFLSPQSPRTLDSPFCCPLCLPQRGLPTLSTQDFDPANRPTSLSRSRVEDEGSKPYESANSEAIKLITLHFSVPCFLSAANSSVASQISKSVSHPRKPKIDRSHKPAALARPWTS